MDLYRKTALIEAYHYPFADDVPQYFKDAVVDHHVTTLEGDSHMLDDCWVARNTINGEFWRIDNNVFATTYERANS